MHVLCIGVRTNCTSAGAVSSRGGAHVRTATTNVRARTYVRDAILHLLELIIAGLSQSTYRAVTLLQFTGLSPLYILNNFNTYIQSFQDGVRFAVTSRATRSHRRHGTEGRRTYRQYLWGVIYPITTTEGVKEGCGQRAAAYPYIQSQKQEF